MANDALTISDSVSYAPKAEQKDSLVSIEEMKGFQDIKAPSDNSTSAQLDYLPPVELAEALESPEQTQLDDASEELSALLKNDSTPEDAFKTFEEFMSKNGDAMYANAESINPGDPLKTIADSLNKAMEDSRYSFSGGEGDRSQQIWISADGQQIAGVDAGPSLEDMLGIPKEFQAPNGGSDETERSPF